MYVNVYSCSNNKLIYEHKLTPEKCLGVFFLLNEWINRTKKIRGNHYLVTQIAF